MGINSHSAYVFVDAGYVRAELKKASQDDEFNPSHLWQRVPVTSADGQPIRPVRMFFYDAVDEGATDAEKQKLQGYLTKVEQVPFVSVVTGFVRPGKKKNREQKGVDVQIAVDALEAAWTKRAEAICLVSGDADFCPLAEAVRRAGAYMLVFGYQAHMSQELIHSADYVGYLPDPREGHLKPF